MNIQIILLILSALVLLLDTFVTPPPSVKVRLLSLGLALFVLSFLVQGTLKTP